MKATLTAPKGTMMILYSVSLHAVIIDPSWAGQEAIAEVQGREIQQNLLVGSC